MKSLRWKEYVWWRILLYGRPGDELPTETNVQRTKHHSKQKQTVRPVNEVAAERRAANPNTPLIAANADRRPFSVSHQTAAAEDAAKLASWSNAAVAFLQDQDQECVCVGICTPELADVWCHRQASAHGGDGRQRLAKTNGPVRTRRRHAETKPASSSKNIHTRPPLTRPEPAGLRGALTHTHACSRILYPDGEWTVWPMLLLSQRQRWDAGLCKQSCFRPAGESRPLLMMSQSCCPRLRSSSRWFTISAVSELGSFSPELQMMKAQIPPFRPNSGKYET